MNKQIFGALALAMVCSSVTFAQQAPAQPPAQPMSFFVTSKSKGDGGNYGGLAGADQWCQNLAAAAGAGNRTWHAYLSTQGPNAVNARDRIGSGPWYNAKGQPIAKTLSELHGDTLDEARLGNAINQTMALDEKGGLMKGSRDTPNQHDILTGSLPDGRTYNDGKDHTCNNYTSNTTGNVQLGHFDRSGLTNGSWNSAHPSRGCTQPNLIESGGAGYLYCFAIDAPQR
ncbi:MAG: lectin [Bryobacteraceae bacterium]